MIGGVLTIAETEIFSALWPDYWTDEEFGEFCLWLALNPDAGDVIAGSGGCRKVRWSVAGRGKRGGVRVIYFKRLAERRIWLLVIYAKNVRATIGGDQLRVIRETIDG
jgi:RelE toxin of RelE / RelB toxin-antitoxin system